MNDFPGNNNNIDFDDVSLSAFLSPIDTPWLSTDASELDLLTASVDCVDAASRALHGATPHPLIALTPPPAPYMEPQSL